MILIDDSNWKYQERKENKFGEIKFRFQWKDSECKWKLKKENTDYNRKHRTWKGKKNLYKNWSSSNWNNRIFDEDYDDDD